MSEALLARRKLGNELLRLREDAGWTQAQIGKLLWTSGTTVHRMEQGRSQIKGPQIGALLRGLGIDDPKLEARLVQLAELSHDGGQPYDQYRESLSNEALQFFGYEEVATAIRDLQIVFVPGLLQSDDYAREVIRSVQGITGDIEGFLSSRRDRQQKVIFRDTPPSLSFMIDEAVLYRPFGSAAIMSEQLRRLQELAERPGISIKVVPLARGQPGPARIVHPPGVRQSTPTSSSSRVRAGISTSTRRKRPAPAVRRGRHSSRNSRPNRISTTTYEGRLTNYSASEPPTPHGPGRYPCLHSLGLPVADFPTSYNGSRFRAHGSRL